MSALLETTFTNKEDSLDIVKFVVQQAFESVCSTMGPDGRYVVINQTNQPNVTKDGVSVAKALDFNEVRKNMIAKIITEPAIKTDLEVGDGTTTTIFQMYHLYQKFGHKLTFKNTRYLDNLIKGVKEFLGTQIVAGDVHSEEFRRMLMTSANYEETIVEKILDIYKEYDQPNVVLQKAPMLGEDETLLAKDIVFNSELGNDALVSLLPPGGADFLAGNAAVVLIDGGVNTIMEETISMITNLNINIPTLVIARNWDINAVGVIMNLNNQLKRPAIIPIRLQAAGSLGTAVFNDLGDLLGAPVVNDLRNLVVENITTLDTNIKLFPTGIHLKKEDPTVAERADKILVLLDDRYSKMSIIDRQIVIGRELFRRISRLRANNVIIRVTGTTPSDAKERYYRYEDVMKAAKTGLQYGVIPGIGYGYMQAAEWVKQQPQQSDEELELLRNELAELLTYQYIHLTKINSNDKDFGKYIDLVTGEVSDKPTTVYDNAAATMIALEGAWATAKTLGKLNNIMGRSNQSYT